MSIMKKLISIGENGYEMQIKKFSKSHILVVYVSRGFTHKVFILNKYLTRYHRKMAGFSKVGDFTMVTILRCCW